MLVSSEDAPLDDNGSFEDAYAAVRVVHDVAVMQQGAAFAHEYSRGWRIRDARPRSAESPAALDGDARARPESVVARASRQDERAPIDGQAERVSPDFSLQKLADAWATGADSLGADLARG